MRRYGGPSSERMQERTTPRESDMSLGFMVAVHEAATHEEAYRLAEILSQKSIPALVQSKDVRVDGLIVPEGDRDIWILVPQALRPEALEILSRTPPPPPRPIPLPVPRPIPLRVPSEGQPFQARIGRDISRPLPVRWPPGPENVIEGRPTLPEEDDDSLERHEPAPSPLGPRVLAAVLAIGSGILVQRGLELSMGSRQVVQTLAASTIHPEELWRLVTAGFIHGSFAHFGMNALFALILGVVLFGTHGFGATTATWIMSSILGLYAEQSFSPATHILGASAGIYGLIGLWWGGQLQRARRAVLPRRERWRAAGVLLLLVPGALTPFTSTGGGVAVLAHLFGFLSGWALSVVFRRRLSAADEARTSKISMAGFAVGVLLICAGWIAAFPSITQAW